jgi:hypothetical protein
VGRRAGGARLRGPAAPPTLEDPFELLIDALDEVDRAGSLSRFGYVIGPDGQPIGSAGCSGPG